MLKYGAKMINAHYIGALMDDFMLETLVLAIQKLAQSLL